MINKLLNYVIDFFQDEKLASVSIMITIMSFIISIIIIISSNSIGKKALYAKTISENRIKWLYKIRRMIFSFIKKSRDKKVNNTELNNIKNQIQLYYNRKEQEQLLVLLNNIIEDKENEDLKEELIIYCQDMFKSEWDKVKKEAGESLIKRLFKRHFSELNIFIRKNLKKILAILIIFIIIFTFSKLPFNFNIIKVSELVNMNEIPDVINDIIIPIILSIVAAIIFWLIFNFIPDNKRYRNIRPKIDYNLYSIYCEVFSFIDFTIRDNISSPSMFQDKLRGGTLKIEIINKGLNNKTLLTYGAILGEKATRIDLEINRLFFFNTYLSSKEILLLEEIRTKLFTYSYSVNKNSLIQNAPISYMSNNIYEIYKLFIILQDNVFKCKYKSNFKREIYIYYIQYLFYSNNYILCNKYIKAKMKEFSEDKNILEGYGFLCDYKLNRKNEAYIRIEKLFKDNIHLIGNRSFLAPVINDKKILELLIKYYSQNEIAMLIKIINDEDKQHAMFLEK